jgi:PASTA domain
VPPAFDVIVERLTATSLARRYATADDAAADLRRLRVPAARTTPMAVVTSPLPVSSSRRRSNTGWIMALALVLIVAIGVLVAWLVTRDDGSTEKVNVPAVVGQPVLAAQRAIEQAGLRASTVNQANPTIAPGLVFDQSPPGASLAKKGSEVQLSVSTGPPPTSTTTTTSTSTTSSTTTTSTTSSTTTTTITTP